MRLGPALVAALWLTLPAARAEDSGPAGAAQPTPATAPPASPPTAPPASPPTAAPTPATPTPAPAGGANPAQAAAQRQVDGSVVRADLASHRITVATPAGPVEVAWDRNTLIYQPGGATTGAALQPGTVVRAGLDPAGTAYWIQLRPPPAAAP